MRKFMSVLLRGLLFILLTVLTQIGGLSYLISLLISKRLSWSRMKRWTAHLVVYLVATLLIVPLLADRKPLPWSHDQGIEPVSVLTCLLNRHYVDTEMYDVVMDLSIIFPQTIEYMDANFPFVDGFPLLPHLSHDDGEKLDLAFQYVSPENNIPLTGTLTHLGYGSFETAQNGEFDAVEDCQSKGHWQYSMTSIFPRRKTKAVFEAERTRQLVLQLVKDPRIGKIFIEPHLKSRLELDSPKVRFHGCHAVRHDDHIHIQL